MLNKERKHRKKPSDEEHKIQCSCVSWFRAKYPMLAANLFAVPNGGRRDATTGAKLKAEGVLAGVADLILLFPSNGYHALLIEMKTSKGKQSEAQKAWQKKMEEYEYRYVVCRSLDEFMNNINGYLRL
jgi:hypothetical protein